MNEPLPGRKPTASQLAKESDDFMAALGTFGATGRL